MVGGVECVQLWCISNPFGCLYFVEGPVLQFTTAVLSRRLVDIHMELDAQTIFVNSKLSR